MEAKIKFTEHLIYDTSYLMKPEPKLQNKAEKLVRKKLKGMNKNVRRQITGGVMKEIQRSLSSKSIDKKVGSTAVRRYLTDLNGAFTQVDNVTNVPLRQSMIGADSDADIEVISLAINVSKTNPNDLVMVMSHDTGIQLELSRWKNGCPNLYYLSSEKMIDYKKAIADKFQFHFPQYAPYCVVREHLSDNSTVLNIIESKTFMKYAVKKERPNVNVFWYEELYNTED